MQKGGVYSLLGSHAHFVEGINGVMSGVDGTFLHLYGKKNNYGPHGVRIPLISFGNQRTGRLPPVDGQKLLSAVPIVEEDRIVALSAGNPYAVAVLFIDAARLAFDDLTPISGLTPDRLRLWPGGEGVAIPNAYAGDRYHIDQQQLFVLREDQHIIVADDSNRVAKVRFREGCFNSALATRDDLIAHAIGRGMRALNTGETKWCLRILKRLDARQDADPVLAKAWSIDPHFKFDWNRL